MHLSKIFLSLPTPMRAVALISLLIIPSLVFSEQSSAAKPDDEADNINFVLATKLKDNSQFQEAIFLYKQSLMHTTDSSLKAELLIKLAECYESKKEWVQALSLYLEAYQVVPNDLRPIEKISRYYRENGQTQLSYMFADYGRKLHNEQLKHNKDSTKVYDYHIDENLSISAYYTDFKQEGFDAIQRLILLKNVPDFVKDNAYRNLAYYAKTLPQADYLPITFQLPHLLNDPKELFRPLNPSIIKSKQGYDILCRTTDFEQENGQNYHSRDPSGIINTRNYLLKYDMNFKLISSKEILEKLPRERHPTVVQGLEDCRLFKYKNNDWFTCVTYDTSLNGINQTLCRIGTTETPEDILVDHLAPLKSPSNRNCEKNWLPFVKHHILYSIYQYSPFTLLKINENTGSTQIVLQYDQDYDFSRFRGSASPIEYENGYLILVHEVVFEQNKRLYYHRLLSMDGNFKINKVSKPFIFKHIGIEYSCGMTLDHSNNKLIFTIGYEDKEAYFCIVDKALALSLLEPLP